MNRHDAIAFAGGKRNRYNSMAGDLYVALWVDSTKGDPSGNAAASVMAYAMRSEVKLLEECYREIEKLWEDVAVKMTAIEGLEVEDE